MAGPGFRFRGQNPLQVRKLALDFNPLDRQRTQQLIPHEMVHIFQQQLLGRKNLYALQTWFSEGMAVAFSGQSVIWEANDFTEAALSLVSIPAAKTIRDVMEVRYDQERYKV